MAPALMPSARGFLVHRVEQGAMVHLDPPWTWAAGDCGPFCRMALKLRTLGQRLKPSTRAKVALPAKKADPFYLSPEWRALMAAIIKARFGGPENARCEDP